MRISSMQLFWMLVSFEISTGFYYLHLSIEHAQQDAWISSVLAGLAILALTFLYLKIGALYPNQTLIEYSQSILGKWLGKLVAIPFLLQWYFIVIAVLTTITDFIKTILFDKTPIIVITLLIISMLVYILYRGGLEVIARFSELAGPILYAVLILLILMSIFNLNAKHIFPIYADSGVIGILKGTVPPLGFLGEAVVLLMLTGFVADSKKMVPRAMLAIAVPVFFVLLMTVEILMTFGPNVSQHMRFPFYNMVRYISVMEFLQNLEILFVIAFVLAIFVKCSMYFFLASYGTAQWLGIKHWKRLVWPLVVICGITPLVVPNISIAVSTFNKYVWYPYVIPLNFIFLPLLLWVVGTMRKRKGATSSRARQG